MPNSILAAIIILVLYFSVIEYFIRIGEEDPLDKIWKKSHAESLRIGDKEVHFRSYFNPEITSQKDKKIADCCSNYLALQDAPLFDHMSLVDGEIWLYRDEIMNDDVISKLQDALASTDLKIKIVYDWKH